MQQPLNIVYTGTRPPSFASQGVAIHHLPMLEPRCIPFDVEALRAIIRDRPATLVFYSQSGARCVIDSGLMEGLPAISVRCWAVGEATGRLLHDRLGLEVFVPEEQCFEALVPALCPTVPDDGVVLSFEIDDGERSLHDACTGRPFEVVSTPVYGTSFREHRGLRAELEALGQAWVVFSSPRGFEGFLRNLGEDAVAELRAARETAKPDRLRFAAIGPTTTAALAARGFEPDLVPPEPSVDAMLQQITLRERRAPTPERH